METKEIDLNKVRDASAKLFDGLVELADSVPDLPFRELIMHNISTYWLNSVINNDRLIKRNSDAERSIIAKEGRRAYNKIYKITYGRDNPFPC